MKIHIMAFLLASCFVFNGNAYCMQEIDTKIKVIVVDEFGEPVDGADVRASLEQYSLSVKAVSVKGKTNADGGVTISGKSSGYVVIRVYNDSYYGSGVIRRFFDKKGGRWEPWNQVVKVVLRKIVNPVPMYARDTNLTGFSLPAIGEWVGLDLVKHDWCSPYGRGVEPDFMFKFVKDFKSYEDYHLEMFMKFANEHDGIIKVYEDISEGSDFPLARFAPEDGYKASWVFWSKNEGEGPRKNVEKNAHYYFRVRSSEEDGKIKAMYGKVHRDMYFGLWPDGNVRLFMRYYLNPDYTRNLEYDPKRNLAGEDVGLK